MNIGKGRFLMCLSLILIFGAVTVNPADAAFFGLFKSKKKADVAVKKSLVIFPFDQNSNAKVDGFGEELAAALRSSLAVKSPYSTYLYTIRLSPIKRATDDNTIKAKEDIEPPFSEDPAKAMALAKILASDYFLVGSVEHYQSDAAKSTAQITVRADLYLSDSKSEKPAKTLVVTGVTPAMTKATEDDELRAIAAGDAIAKLQIELLSEPKPESKAVETAPAATAPVETAPAEAIPAEAAPPAQ